MTRIRMQMIVCALLGVAVATGAGAITTIPEEDLEPFGSPCNLNLAQIGGTRALSWSAVSGASTYKIGRVTCDGAIEGLDETTGTSYSDTSWSADVCYEYVMVAYDAGGERVCSAHIENVGRCPCP